MKRMNGIAGRIMAGMLVGLLGCNGPGGTGGTGPGSVTDVKEFEGVITYRVSYKGRGTSSMYGDTMRLYYSKGNLAKVYNGQGPAALRKEVFLSEKQQYFALKAMSDTVYTYDLKLKGSYKMIGTEHSLDETRILGHVCKTLQYQDEHSELHFYVFNSMSYPKDMLRVDKRHFTYWNFGHFNTYIDEAGVLYLKNEQRFQSIDGKYAESKIATAVDIREQKVDPAIFHVDTTMTKPLVL